MTECTNCLYTTAHPLGLTLDDSGLCSGCRVHREKDQLDWGSRFQKLLRLADDFRSNSGRTYDCIVPVSGARDSFFIADTVVRRLKLKPLFVAYNSQYMTKAGHDNIALLRSAFDKDIISQTLNPDLIKKVTLKTLETIGSMYWHVLAGQTVLPVQIAVFYRVPLIIWGAHQGCDQVGMFSHTNEVEMTRRYRREHDLMGLEAEDLDDGRFSEHDLKPFIYPDDREIEAVGIRGIYLGNYLRWDSLAQHADMQQKYRYTSVKPSRTFDPFNDVDSCHYGGLHDLIKYLKHGYGKATDHACREIRLGRLSKPAAKELASFYECKFPGDLDQFCTWLGVGEADLWEILKPHFKHLPAGCTDFSSLRRHFSKVSRGCAPVFPIAAADSAGNGLLNPQLLTRGLIERTKVTQTALCD